MSIIGLLRHVVTDHNISAGGPTSDLLSRLEKGKEWRPLYDGEQVAWYHWHTQQHRNLRRYNHTHGGK